MLLFHRLHILIFLTNGVFCKTFLDRSKLSSRDDFPAVSNFRCITVAIEQKKGRSGGLRTAWIAALGKDSRRRMRGQAFPTCTSCLHLSLTDRMLSALRLGVRKALPGRLAEFGLLNCLQTSLIRSHQRSAKSTVSYRLVPLQLAVAGQASHDGWCQSFESLTFQIPLLPWPRAYHGTTWFATIPPALHGRMENHGMAVILERSSPAWDQAT